MKFLYAGAILAYALSLYGCDTSYKKHKLERSFYYWRSSGTPSASEYRLADSLKAKTLYVRMFDVDWNEIAGAHPVAPLNMSYEPEPEKLDLDIIPVVFITNRTFQHVQEPALLDSLARRILHKIGSLSPIERVRSPWQEFQIDCDWTPSTREAYFTFLKAFKARLGWGKLSVTLRMYPYKYRKTMGVPPADRAMLMCYNLGGVNKAATRNSIFNLGELKKYLDNREPYPLPLDVALPVFSWGALFHQNKFAGLIGGLNAKSITDLSFFKKEEGNRYRSVADTVYGRYYIREGDVLRLETVAAHDLQKAALILSRKVPHENCRLSLFDLDSTVLESYSYETLDRIYRSFP